MISKIRKAVVAFVGAGVAGVVTGLTDGDLSDADVAAAVGMGVVAAIAVWRVPNAK